MVITVASRFEPLINDGVFEPAGHYFDTPTYGLAPVASYEALVLAARRWREGVAPMSDYDAAVAQSRDLFARIIGVNVDNVAIGANVSSLVGPVVAAIPAGQRVLVPEGEFTSLLFPLLVNRGLKVRLVPLGDLAASIDNSVDVVAFSLVQSSSGEIADVEAIQAATRDRDVIKIVDATHAVGWLPFDPSSFDFVFVAAYKWLLCPRGVAFMSINSEFDPPPLNAGWYSGEDPWSSVYGAPLRLATSARRFDTSPAWLSWMAAVPSLELIYSLGVDRIHDHDLALANQIRARLEMAPSDSAIVTLPLADPQLLEAKGVKAAVRSGSVRIGCHVNNSPEDVDALLGALGQKSAQ